MRERPKIVLCFPAEPEHVRQIAAAGDFDVIDAGQERIADALLEADIFCGHAKVPVPWDRVVQQGKLRWIQSSAAGLDHCLVPEVIGSNIVVTSASGLFARQVAEQTLALLLGFMRSMAVFYRAQQLKQFVRRPTRDLHGHTIGIVGFGGNGRQIAKVLAPFGVRMIATDVYPVHKPPYLDCLWPADRLSELLRLSDVVILCVPLNARTHGLIDAHRLAEMKPNSLLVNVARGPVVVETSLVEALQTGPISGAALDVTEVEPLDPSSPLWEMENVIITPHVGAQSRDRESVTTDFFCENLRRWQAGQDLWNEVDKQLGFPTPEKRVSLEQIACLISRSSGQISAGLFSRNPPR